MERSIVTDEKFCVGETDWSQWQQEMVVRGGWRRMRRVKEDEGGGGGVDG